MNVALLNPKKTARKDVIREGDRVKVLRSRTVLRVGYPKTVRDYFETAKEQYGPALDDIIDKIEDYPRYGLRPRRIDGRHPDNWLEGAKSVFLHSVARRMAKDDGFGGKERSVHFIDEMMDVVDWMGTVTRTRLVRTGTYYRPTSGYYCRHTGEYDSGEPGGLENPKTHKLVTVNFTCWEFEFHSDDLQKVVK